MSRHFFGLAPAVLLAAGWLTWGLAETAVPQTAEPALKPKAEAPKRGKDLRAALAKRINLEKGIDPNTPLKDALDFLAEETGVNIIIDSQAYAAIGVQKPEEQPVSLPRMRNIRLSHVLRLLLGQIKGDTYAGAILVRPDYVEVTSAYDALSAVAGKDASQLFDPEKGPPRVLSIVYTDFDKQPLSEALAELADATGVSIVIDPRVGDKSKAAVTGTFNNVFVDTAVNLLADMADLKAVQKDAVFYVTTKENAKTFEEPQKPASGRRNPFEQPAQPKFPKPNPGGGM